MNADISAQNPMNDMKNILKKSAIFILIASAGLTVSGRAYMHHPPRFRHPAPPPPPAGHPAPPPAIYPYHMGGKWIAVGGISYLTGTIIRTCPEKPSVILIPQTVIVETLLKHRKPPSRFNSPKPKLAKRCNRNSTRI